jgi:hypothetical protein
MGFEPSVSLAEGFGPLCGTTHRRAFAWPPGESSIDAWRYARHLGRGLTSRYSTLRWSGFSVMVQCPPRACEKAEDFHQKRNGGPTVGEAAGARAESYSSQPLRWYRLSYRANVTTVRHGQRTPPAGVKRWV